MVLATFQLLRAQGLKPMVPIRETEEVDGVCI
jgi:hypothetical protein